MCISIFFIPMYRNRPVLLQFNYTTNTTHKQEPDIKHTIMVPYIICRGFWEGSDEVGKK